MDSAPPSARAQGEAHGVVQAEDGTRLFVRSKDGDHPEGVSRLFFCDGILCDGYIWKYAWSDLAPLAPLTHFHYRGHGRSGPPGDPDRIDIAAHADDLMGVRASVGDPPSILIGHSMGCQVALECYHRYPKSVRGLILLCGTFGKVTKTFRGLPILDLILPKVIDAATKAPAWVRAVWSRIPADVALRAGRLLRDIDPERIREEDILPYLRHMTNIDFALFTRMLRAAGEHTAEDYLSEIRVPTLIVAGERDTFTPPFLAESMAKSIPDSELYVVPNGSHVVPLEQPTLVNGRMEAFLRERQLVRV